MTSDGWYCKDHECKEPNCHQERQTGVRYCAAHKFPGCPSRCRENGLYCDACRCSFNDDCADIRVSESRYCNQHTCGVSWCFEPSHFVSGYCNGHTCNWKWESQESRCRLQCGERVHTWCSQHICYEPGCHAVRQSELGYYCESHTCSRENCWKQRDAVSGIECTEHARRDLVPAPVQSYPVQQQQYPRKNAVQDYRDGFIHGFEFGINLDGADQDLARRMLQRANRAINQRVGG